jgi:hypothetical protein
LHHLDMKSLTLIALLTAAAAGCQGAPVQRIFQIAPSSAVRVESGSHLQVPASCPVYAPGDFDVDTPEQPFPDHVTIMCVVDDQGNTYGLVTGDNPGSTLAVIPGDRELGYYIGFDASAGFTPARAILDGDTPDLEVWSAPDNVSTSPSCCAENDPNNRLAVQTVAVGNGGWLVSLGKLNADPTQVAIFLNTSQLVPAGPSSGLGGFIDRFYVNGAP